MSRTDKTAPHWRKVTEHPAEVHDQADGVCDIAGRGPDLETISWRGGRCYYEARWWEPTYSCACSLCGIPIVEDRRRRKGREQTRNWWREY